MKKLKASQYNYFVDDKDGDLIICNFAKGYKSLCKIRKNDVSEFYNFINDPQLYYDANNPFIVDLCDRGILVAEDCDELLSAYAGYYDAAMSSEYTFIVMPTEQCNFRCKYCYESYEKGTMTKENQVALLKFIQKKLTTTNSIVLSWFGGEPLMALEVVDYITKTVKSMCEKKKVLFASDMTTNGYNLNPDVFERLYKLNVWRYQITLDGLKVHHDQQRVSVDGGGTFDRILDNLLYIKNSPQYKFAEITIRVNVTRSILNELDKVIAFYKETFGSDRRFGLVLTPVSDLGGQIIKTISDSIITQEELYKRINEIGLYNDTSIELPLLVRSFVPSESLCYASKKNTLVFGTDLTIYKCTVHFELKENAIGRVLPNGDAIINADYHCKWYMNHELKDMCRKCFLFPVCFGGGCPHKRCFVCNSNNTCVFKTWKKEIKNAITYITSRFETKTLCLTEVRNEK